MKATELSDDRVTSPKLLEQRLFATDFPEFVAALIAYRGNGDRTLESIVGNNLPGIMEQGLSVLAAGQIRSLLDNPRVLPELQDRVFDDGGDYWVPIIAAAKHRAGVDLSVDLSVITEHHFTPIQPTPVQSNAVVELAAKVDPSPATSRSSVWQALAAGILIAIGLYGYEIVRGRMDPASADPIAFATPAVAGPLENGELLRHLAAGLENLQGDDRDEATFATRVSQCNEACLLTMRTTGRMPAGVRKNMEVACQKWLLEMAEISSSSLPLAARSKSLNELLGVIGSKLREMGDGPMEESHV